MKTTKLGPRASILSIESVSVNHLGLYTCQATSPAGTSNYTTELKEVMGRVEADLKKKWQQQCVASSSIKS